MNEQVISDLYNRAVSNGYKKSREEFVSLIQTNDAVLNDMYSYVQSKGYGKGVEDFSVLVGKKKDDTGLSTVDGTSALPSGEKDTLIERSFGKNAVTDFFGDIYRSYEAGSSKVENVDPTMNIFGKKASELDDASLEEFVKSYGKLANTPITDEMRQYQKDVEEAGGGFVNSLIQAVKNPGIIPQLVVDSFSMMVPFTDEGISEYGLAGAGAGALALGGTGAALGALGGPFAPVTATAGAVAGGLRGLMAGMSATTEVALSYGQFLKEEADKRGLEFNAENLKKLLEDENVVNEATNRSLARGATIGLVDAVTSGIAGRAMGATKAAVKGTAGKALGTAAGLGVESVGEGVGEGAAQVAAGQEISGEEIALEMLGGFGGGVFNVAVENLIGGEKVGRYRINGEEVSKNRLNKFLSTATPDQVAKTNIEIIDDNDALKIAEDKKKEALLAGQIDPAVTDETEKAKLVKLEKERANLKGNDTKSAQNRVRAIDEEIDAITGKYTLQVEEEGISYKIDGSKMDRARFVAAVGEAKNEEALNELETTDPEVQKVIDAKRAELTGEIQPVTINVADKYTTDEVERVKKLPIENEDGATMNLDGTKYEKGGLVIPLASRNLPLSELTAERINQFVQENSEAIGSDMVKVGIYKFPGRNEASIDINIVADRSRREEALAIARELGQESIFDLDTFENVKTGADGKNPKVLTPKEFLGIQDRLSRPVQTEVIVTPETSSNYANMTEDNEGNFVFFHVGKKGYDTVKRGTGKAPVTSREEASALGKVGGMAMYYTGPEQGERQSAEGAKYAVKVPKEKVYDFNTDPLNLIEEAKKRHEEENPGKAFDPNSQIAYVTKIAGERGFDMVVADWAGGTRAQTTKELAPVDVEESTGNVVEKKFSEEFKSNKEKGFKSVVPARKADKLQKVYEKINEARNSEKRYDDLYRLYTETEKYTQQEITDLINNSDLSQELKDEYNAALDSKEEKRRSEKPAKVETAKQKKEALPENVEEAIKNSAKTLQTSFPGVKIIVADNISDAKKQIVDQLTPIGGKEAAESVAEQMKTARGQAVFYNGKPVAVIINKEKASSNTAAHEVWHLILREAFGRDAKKFKSFQNAIARELKNSGYTDVSEYLDRFAAAYEGDTAYEEYLAELGGLLTTKGFDPKNLTAQEKSILNKIKDIINKFAKSVIGKDLFLKDAKPENILEFMINVSDLLAKGEDVRPVIGKTKAKKAKGIESSLQNDFSDSVSKLTFIYDKNSKKFEQLKKDGFINDNVSINDFNGKTMLLHQPDAAFSGEIQKNGETIVEGKGGIFFPAKFHEDLLFWAGTKNTISQFVNSLNKISKSNGGKIYMALTSAPYHKLLSSTTMSNALVDFFSSKTVDKNFKISEAQLKSSLVDAAKHKTTKKITNKKTGKVSYKEVGLKINLSKNDSIESIKSKIAERLGPDNSNFDDRKLFSKQLIKLMANQINKNEVSIASFGKLFSQGIQNKYFKGITKTGKIKISAANMEQALSEMFTEPMLKEGFNDRSLGGEVYAIIEVDGEVEAINTDKHESYPVAVKAKNPVKIHILKDRVNWYDVFNKEGETGGIKESERTSVYPSTGVSTSGLQLNIPLVEVSQQKQLPARVNEQINNIISEQKALGNKPVDVAREATKYLKSTEAYNKLGDRDKAKVLSGVKRLSGMRVKVTVDEYASLKDQIRLEAKAAKDAVTDYKTSLRNLVASVRALVKAGKISTFRAGVIIGRISKTNLTSPESVNKTISYVADIFDNANLAMKVSRAKSLIKNAKRNIKSKIGQNPDLFTAAKVLASIDPHFIPTPMIDDYLEIMEVIGERARVLSIQDAGDLTAKMNVIINAVMNESESVVNSAEQEKITMTPEESVEAAQSLIDQIKSDKLDTSNIVDPNDAAVARSIASITENDMNDLLSVDKDGITDFSKLKLLLGIRENIKAGIVTHEAMVLSTAVNQNRNKNQLQGVVNNLTGAKILNGVTRTISKIKGAITKRGGVLEAIRSTPLEFIDDVIGNFNDKTIHKLTFGILGSAKGQLDARLADLAAKAAAAEKLLQSAGRTDNAVVEAKYKIMVLQLQREFESNPGSPSVAPAIEFIDATLRAITRKESSLTNNDARILQEVRSQLTANGIAGIENSLTENDKKAMALIDEINAAQASEALFTSAVIRGNRVNIINNYVHHAVLSKNLRQEVEAILNRLFDRGASGKPSTKAGTLNERTPGAKAIMFDPVSASMRGARETLTDFYMTPAIREVTGTLNKLKDSVFDDPNSTQEQRDVAQALVESVQESLEVTFQNHFGSDSAIESFLKAIQKLGYQTTLASIPRAFAELSSNMSFAILSDPKTTNDALKYTKFAFSTNLLPFLEKIKSAESTRLAGNQTLTGKYAEGGFAAGYGRTSKSAASSKVMDYASFITRMTIGKAYRVADVISDLLISTPDKVVSRAFYVADFINNFEKETGIRLTNNDLNKIADGTSEYLSPEFESAIQKARQTADSNIVRMAASGNSFNTILKNAPRKTDNAAMSAYRAINSFMSRFYLTEYGTLRSAVIALFKSGEIDKKAASAIIAASVTRMSMYLVAYSLLSSLFDSMIAQGLDLEEEEEDDEDLITKMKRSIVGTGVGVLSRRTLGNLGYMPIAFAVEQLNEDLGEDFGLRDDDYDPYKNSLVYSKVSENDLLTKNPFEVIAKAVAGPLSPAISSAARAVTLYGRATKEGSKKETKERALEELETRMVLEAAGNLGLIPFYKDARRILLNDFYARNYDKKDDSSFTITKKQIDLVRKSNPTLARELQRIYNTQKAEEKKLEDFKKKFEKRQTKSN